MIGDGIPFVPEAHPEYEAFYNSLCDFDKEAFKRFRGSHPTLTNQEVMSMFKLNYGHSHNMGCNTEYIPQRHRDKQEPSLMVFWTFFQSAIMFFGNRRLGNQNKIITFTLQIVGINVFFLEYIMIIKYDIEII